jgi:hypothetical protein
MNKNSAKDENDEQLLSKFPLAPMGALAPGSAHARPSAQAPIDTSGILSQDARTNYVKHAPLI